MIVRKLIKIDQGLWDKARIAAVLSGKTLMMPDGLISEAIREYIKKYDKYIEGGKK